MKPIRRKDRAVTDFEKVVSLFMDCEVAQIGLYDEEDPMYPYIVPMNYTGYVEGEQMYMLMHGSTMGRKMDLIRKNKVCSFVIDGNREVEVLAERKDITTRYESIMGKAEIEILEGDEAIESLSYVADNYAGYEFDWDHRMMKVTSVMRLKVTDWSCKINAKPEKKED